MRMMLMLVVLLAGCSAAPSVVPVEAPAADDSWQVSIIRVEPRTFALGWAGTFPSTLGSGEPGPTDQTFHERRALFWNATGSLSWDHSRPGMDRLQLVAYVRHTCNVADDGDECRDGTTSMREAWRVEGPSPLTIPEDSVFPMRAGDPFSLVLSAPDRADLVSTLQESGAYRLDGVVRAWVPAADQSGIPSSPSA